LILWGWNLTDAGLAHLAKLPQLTTLNLESCENLTDAGLAQLRPLHGLVELNLPSSITNDARNAFYAPG
jgi:F-box/leucine-rich repeat protein 14